MNITVNSNKHEIKVCTSFKGRLLGLMFKRNIYICCFPKCNSIHTFFMKQKIDVVITDKNFKIVYLYKNLKPWNIILPKKKGYYTFEFPVNLINYKLNDTLEITFN